MAGLLPERSQPRLGQRAFPLPLGTGGETQSLAWEAGAPEPPLQGASPGRLIQEVGGGPGSPVVKRPSLGIGYGGSCASVQELTSLRLSFPNL